MNDSISHLRITDSILDMNLDPKNTCGCYLHKAILNFFPALNSYQILVTYHKIMIGNKPYNVSPQLEKWQKHSVSLDEHGEKHQPTNVILDHDRQIAYIEGENKGYYKQDFLKFLENSAFEITKQEIN